MNINFKLLRILLILLCNLLMIGISPPLFGQSEVSQEHKLKAAFIYNFTKYIQWPSSDTPRAFEIAIIGDTNIITPLEEIAEKKSVNNREIRIKRCQDIEDINMCDIVFISASEIKWLADVLEKVGDKHILTVSDNEGFAEKGVAINFVMVGGKVKFEMNSHAIDRAGLRVSSQLQKLAILVEEKGKQGSDSH